MVPGPGSSLDGGKYRIVRLIAEGGMGAVYEAEHTLMKKRVAIKWIRPGLATKARAADRMVQEARAAARIRHPNVVDIYDVGREDGAIYLVMEYLEGEPLSALIDRGGTPMNQFIALLLPALRGVAAAHRKGVVHRDIKPDNIYLTRIEDAREPLTKVLDFGISKLEPRGEEHPSLTRSGGTVGTPNYMSYEQLHGSRTVDGRSDVYAFGVILYEALTGRHPHEADSYPALIVNVTTTTAAPARERNPSIPVPLDRIISWAIARLPEERIESLDALIRELEPFATEAGFRADMETDEIPCTRAPVARISASVAQRTTAAASALRGSKPLSAARPPSRLALWAIALVALFSIASYAWLHVQTVARPEASAAVSAPTPRAPAESAPVPAAPAELAPVAPPPSVQEERVVSSAAGKPAQPKKRRGSAVPPVAVTPAVATPAGVAPAGVAPAATAPAVVAPAQSTTPRPRVPVPLPEEFY